MRIEKFFCIFTCGDKTFEKYYPIIELTQLKPDIKYLQIGGIFMGFFTDLAKSAGTAIINKAQKLQNLKAEMSCYDDEELKRKYRNGTSDERTVAASLLRDRGYGRRD